MAPTHSDSDQRKTLYFVRHAEAEHNAIFCKHLDYAVFKNPNLIDCGLTNLGKEQALKVYAQEDVRERLRNADIHFVSPLKRAIQTATIILDGNDSANCEHTPLVAMELIRERQGVHYCDVRSSVQDINKQFPHVSTKDVHPELDVFEEDIREPWPAVQDRAREFLHYLLTLPENTITLFSHDGFLTSLTDVLIEEFPHSGAEQWRKPADGSDPSHKHAETAKNIPDNSKLFHIAQRLRNCEVREVKL
eukprot:GCRY01001650.1.p1 GENE.GCRY01001650.1~~GCRY01001650.1.p1  ORF type:complete len:248 (+),score=29.05 GCRY01001650.1:158-901(+)